MSWKSLLLEMLKDDVGSGDITAKAVLPSGMKARGTIFARCDGVAAGLAEAKWLFERAGVKVRLGVRDGQRIKDGTVLVEVEGNARKIFEVERTALNVIGRMGGIATETAKAVGIVKTAKVKVAGTRKTILRWLDKRAIVLGGGLPHRMGLYDEILIKRTQVQLAGGIAKAVERARKNAPGKRMEIEASSAKEALEAAKGGADVVMFDNFSHAEIRKALSLLGKAGLRKRIKVELSGGVTLGNLRKYAKYDADVISMGCLTTAPGWLQASIRLRRA